MFEEKKLDLFTGAFAYVSRQDCFSWNKDENFIPKCQNVFSACVTSIRNLGYHTSSAEQRGLAAQAARRPVVFTVEAYKNVQDTRL